MMYLRLRWITVSSSGSQFGPLCRNKSETSWQAEWTPSLYFGRFLCLCLLEVPIYTSGRRRATSPSFLICVPHHLLTVGPIFTHLSALFCRAPTLQTYSTYPTPSPKYLHGLTCMWLIQIQGLSVRLIVARGFAYFVNVKTVFFFLHVIKTNGILFSGQTRMDFFVEITFGG